MNLKQIDNSVYKIWKKVSFGRIGINDVRFLGLK